MKFPLFFRRTRHSRNNMPANCDICLIVHDRALLHAEQQGLVAQADESLLGLTPAELANASRRLLPGTNHQKRLALALPNSEFIATSLQLPPVGAQNLKNAVSLQLPALLPGVNEPLLLAVQHPADPSMETIALWLPARRAEELFKAFEQADLLLACLIPRALLALPDNEKDCLIEDQDTETITLIHWSGRTVKQWVHVLKDDLDAPAFNSQWQACKDEMPDGELVQKESVDDWSNQPMPSRSIYHYAFVPPGAILQQTQQKQRRNRRRWMLLAGLLGFGLIAGAAAAVYHKQRLTDQLEQLRTRTSNISQLRAEVIEINEQLSAVEDFPNQDATHILETLNRLIPPGSWITSFRMELGQVKIEGMSPDPTQILKALSAETIFSDVKYNIPTTRAPGQSEDKFGIAMNLVNVDVPGYYLQYFPIDR